MDFQKIEMKIELEYIDNPRQQEQEENDEQPIKDEQ